MITPITSAITIAKAKLNKFLVTANLVPNSFFSKGKVTTPTIVNVVKNATAGTILAPASTNDPTNGKATKAGISVMLPTAAEINVETIVFEDSQNGLKAAKAAGAWCVTVDGCFSEFFDLSKSDLHITSLSDLKPEEIVTRIVALKNKNKAL